VAERLTELSCPAPRALRDLRGIRRELCRVYREGKSGLIDPQLFGRLVNCLNTLQALDNGRLLEERLSEVEWKLGSVRPNGRDHSEARP
jgi:hypothetical protein